jgi:Chalcone isomerase-like
MKCPVLLASSLLALAAGSAHGRQCRGIDFPDHIQLDGRELTLNGLGVRKATFLKVNVYVAALYVAHSSQDPAVLIDSRDEQEMLLQFVRGVGAGDLTKGWSEGFARSAGAQLPVLQGRIAMLNHWMSDVETGQRLLFVRRPGSGIQVSINGAVKGTIEGDDFARAFIAIWLGAAPPNPQLKSGLLGGTCE